MCWKRSCPSNADHKCTICGEPGGWRFSSDYVHPGNDPHCLGWYSNYYCMLHYGIMKELGYE